MTPFGEPVPPPVRHRDLLLQATGRDTDLLVHEVLIRFCAAFLDQGFAGWSLPGREAGFFRAFASLYRDARPVAPWLGGLPGRTAADRGRTGSRRSESIAESLAVLGVAEAEREELPHADAAGLARLGGDAPADGDERGVGGPPGAAGDARANTWPSG